MEEKHYCNYCGRWIQGEPYGSPDGNYMCGPCWGKDAWKESIDAEAVINELRQPRGGKAFREPLSFGNPEQIRVLQAMNSDRPYCSHCFDVLERGGACPDVGTPCRKDRCVGHYLPGSGMEAQWRRLYGPAKVAI
jgi:hypothetical protein